MDWNHLAATLISSSPHVLIGLITAGALHQWVPAELLHRHLGRDSRWTLLKGVGIGCILPICSCGTIPLGVGLFRCGAGVGTILAFMTSSPVLSPVMLLLSFNMLGFKVTMTILITTLMSSVTIGWIGNRLFDLKERKTEPARGQTASSTTDLQLEPESFIKWTFGDLGAKVTLEILIGFSVAILVMNVLPMSEVSGALGRNDLLALLLMVIVCFPIYICSVPSVPIVQSLLLMGISPGAAVVYLIAGPATNFGELNAIRANMGAKVSLFYASALIVVALCSGLLTNSMLLPDQLDFVAQKQCSMTSDFFCITTSGSSHEIYRDTLTKFNAFELFSSLFLGAVMIYGIIKKASDHFFK